MYWSMHVLLRDLPYKLDNQPRNLGGYQSSHPEQAYDQASRESRERDPAAERNQATKCG